MWIGVYGGRSVSHGHGTNVRAGLAVLFRRAVGATILSSTEVVEGRFIIVRAEIERVI